MKAYLMHKDKDFDQKQPQVANAKDLTQDLELSTIFSTMAKGDKFLYQVCETAILSGLSDIEDITYRQDILKDCLRNPSVIREIYQLTIDSIENKHRRWLGIISHSSSAVLSSAVAMMVMFVELLKKLSVITDQHAEQFESEGFLRFFGMIKKELNDGYFEEVETHLKQLRFQKGVLISIDLGKGNEGTHHTLRLPQRRRLSWLFDAFSKRDRGYSFSIADRDDAGARALSNLTDRGINLSANALAQSAEHIDKFFDMLRVELAFYIGCLNLYERLVEIGSPISFPSVKPFTERFHSFHGLYDVCLALTVKNGIVGNDLDANQKSLVLVTGANQGGKSTFLRSIGLAQLMMQAGMFVGADDFCANLSHGVFTHYRRKEDATMKSGKLDDELGRMSIIVDQISPDALALFNESFAATNEQEGSEIARQITSALIDRQVKVFFVTHMYEFAHKFLEKQRQGTIFLRAERVTGGKRTFKIIEGVPLQTSFGEDVYNDVFGTE